MGEALQAAERATDGGREAAEEAALAQVRLLDQGLQALLQVERDERAAAVKMLERALAAAVRELRKSGTVTQLVSQSVSQSELQSVSVSVTVGPPP